MFVKLSSSYLDINFVVEILDDLGNAYSPPRFFCSHRMPDARGAVLPWGKVNGITERYWRADVFMDENNAGSATKSWLFAVERPNSRVLSLRQWYWRYPEHFKIADDGLVTFRTRIDCYEKFANIQ